MPRTALRTLMLDVLKATGALDNSIHLSDLDYREAIDALIAGEIDVAMVATQIDDSLLQRALGAPGIQLMNVAQAEAIAKTVPGLKHVVLWRGLISLDRDIPDSDIDLLALRNRLLVQTNFTLLCNICCSKPCAKCMGHRAPLIVSVNTLPNNPMICPSLQRHKRYRSGPTFWQRYTSFWLTSLLNRIVFCHSDRRDAYSSHWLRASLLQMAVRSPYPPITPAWETSNVSSLKAQTLAGSSSIRHESPKLIFPCGCSRLRDHFKSICSD